MPVAGAAVRFRGRRVRRRCGRRVRRRDVRRTIRPCDVLREPIGALQHGSSADAGLQSALESALDEAGNDEEAKAAARKKWALPRRQDLLSKEPDAFIPESELRGLTSKGARGRIAVASVSQCVDCPTGTPKPFLPRRPTLPPKRPSPSTRPTRLSRLMEHVPFAWNTFRSHGTRSVRLPPFSVAGANLCIQTPRGQRCYR